MGPSDRKWVTGNGIERNGRNPLLFFASQQLQWAASSTIHMLRNTLTTGPKARSQLTMHTNLESYESKQPFVLWNLWSQVLYYSNRKPRSTICAPHRSPVTRRGSESMGKDYWTYPGQTWSYIVTYREHGTHLHGDEFIFSLTPLPQSHKWRFTDPWKSNIPMFSTVQEYH